MYEIINKKKRGRALTKKEIKYVVDGFTNGRIPDYQMSALLMAIVIKGMTKRETYELTMAMEESGDMLDLSAINKITADKHSTGGVGDKTSLIVGPIVASCGVALAKMSGRGLGHTGGTIDKLESIPGFKTEISENEFIDIVNRTGMAIISQSAELAPADKKIYALRDVTATVDSIPLIASSIMSKKLASGAKVIVLDVKCGSGAFMKTYEDALKLAKEMIFIGKLDDRKMYAMISDMNQPLGKYVGNRLEVYEAVKTLMNEGPDDLTEACLDLSGLILLGAGLASDLNEGRELARNALRSGSALLKFKEFISSQHGDPSFVDDIENFTKTKYTKEFTAEKSGYINKIDAEKIGLASMYLGGGRHNIGDEIDPDVGLHINARLGDKVNSGQSLVSLFYNDNSDVEQAEAMLSEAYEISEQKECEPSSVHAYAYLDENGIINV